METKEVCFNWSLFWQAASAIATTAAVVVALWQTRYSNKKRLKIKFRDNVILTNKASKESYVELEISNVGNRKIIINRYGMSFNEGFFVVSFPDETEMINTRRPVVLDIEESKIITWKKEEFIQVLKDQCKTSGNSKITLFVQDTAGNFYTTRTPKKRMQYLNENYSK